MACSRIRNAIKDKPKLSTEISDKERAALEREVNKKSTRENRESRSYRGAGGTARSSSGGCFDLADGKEVEWASREP